MSRRLPLRPWALPFVPLYRAGACVDAMLRRSSMRSLAWPVISVGSLSSGGAGKTPVVKLLADLLTRNGYMVDVLSRGYKRRSRVAEQVTVSSGSDDHLAATRFGDEPVELARAGLRVFVARDRWSAGTLAETMHASVRPLVHLLDDGFQHRQLTRKMDVVLLTLADARDWLLPAGDLREPLTALGRADLVLLRVEEAGELKPLVARFSRAPTALIERTLELPRTPVVRPFVFCGIARPGGFLSMIAQAQQQPGAGFHVIGHAIFADHHAYSAADLGRLVQLASAAGATGFFTTAKDAVKLGPGARRQLAAVGPLQTIELAVTLRDEAFVLRSLQDALGPG